MKTLAERKGQAQAKMRLMVRLLLFSPTVVTRGGILPDQE
jgi:hypothetical protein